VVHWPPVGPHSAQLSRSDTAFRLDLGAVALSWSAPTCAVKVEMHDLDGRRTAERCHQVGNSMSVLCPIVAQLMRLPWHQRLGAPLVAADDHLVPAGPESHLPTWVREPGQDRMRWPP
jgi:hypothetical protein